MDEREEKNDTMSIIEFVFYDMLRSCMSGNLLVYVRKTFKFTSI